MRSYSFLHSLNYICLKAHEFCKLDWISPFTAVLFYYPLLEHAAFANSNVRPYGYKWEVLYK